MARVKQVRSERDPLGERAVPNEALYGVQTLRARENFRVSMLRIHPELITAYAEIKKAAAEANAATGALDASIAPAIIEAADEVIAGKWRDQFDLDVFQAGAGTSYNMNMNEVIANRALEILGDRRGNYERIGPNDDVNKSQSTNDTMPTAMRIAAIRLAERLCASLDRLATSFEEKAKEFAHLEKSGRTHLHDAVPMTFGDELGGYAANVRRARERIDDAVARLHEVPLGGTAVGTGTNTKRGYARLAVRHLAAITSLKLRPSKERVALQQSVGDFVALSGALRGLAVELSKIGNDLRLLGSGPHTGFYELELPALQPGSSIMPGKVNPAMAEMLTMLCYHVIGHDTAIAFCAEAGQLEVNVTMPYVAYALLESLELMTNGAQHFDEKAVRGLKPHEDRMRDYARRSVGVAALHNEELGFIRAAEIAAKAAETGKSVPEVLDEEEQ
jgi:aspartate ammonia-lyase